MLRRSAPSPSDRKCAAQCLDDLNKAFPPPRFPPPPHSVSPTPVGSKDQDMRNSELQSRLFDHVSKFIDTFCASGSVFADYDVKPLGKDKKVDFNGDLSVTVLGKTNITTLAYDSRSQKWMNMPISFVRQSKEDKRDWLYVNEKSLRHDGLLHDGVVGAGQAARRYIERLHDTPEFPDYFVCPEPSTGGGFFLPVNKFSFAMKENEGMLDADRLNLVTYGVWFTVFRYTPYSSSKSSPLESIIIKHTHINNATFKYLVQEKAMLHYLNGSQRIAVERLGGGFAPLVLSKITGSSRYQNDRFIAYQDGGRPLEVQFFKPDDPSHTTLDFPTLLHIAQDLLEALVYLFDKRVVHRNLNLGTVVYSKAGGAKLIALGSAKYIDRLPYQLRMQQFEEVECGYKQLTPVHSSTALSLPPTTRTKGDKMNPEDFVHPDAKQES